MDPQVPLSTYRLQFNREFTFQNGMDLAAYLDRLGVGAVYSSPILQARRGSVHGYDVTDYSEVNPELGTEEEFGRMAEQLRSLGMGLLLDIVPNHMCIGDRSNRWWQNVLEFGRNSPFAKYFDIDWNPPKPELVNKVLLPILDVQYGIAIETKGIAVVLENGILALQTPSSLLPICPRSWRSLFEPAIQKLKGILSDDNPNFLEFQSLAFSLGHLPTGGVDEEKIILELQRESEQIKSRLKAVLEACPQIMDALQEQLDNVNCRQDFELLEALLRDQYYRLSYWRVANDEINYRRFFDVNDLAGIRTELPEVFFQVHDVVLRMVSKGWITGLRIDHVDGLYDPEQYFIDLQQNCGSMKAAGPSQLEYEPRPFYIVAEKILIKEEKLLPQWLVHGTTGYDFLNQLNGLFIDPEGVKELAAFYRNSINPGLSSSSILYESKKLILLVSLSAELHVLSRSLDRISEQHRWSRDFTAASIQSALREIIASFPVYRSYVRAEEGEIHASDRNYILDAVRMAKKRNPALSASNFDFIQEVLLLDHPEGLTQGEIVQRKQFVMKFQQLTGPVMAKGMEDTAFYRAYPLASLNEVGGEPYSSGTTPEAFHKINQERIRLQPFSLLATSTHDTKRGEDARARLNVLSEIPDKWMEAALRWYGLNEPFKELVDEELAPDRNEEYLLYQTLVGTWPPNFIDRDPAEVELNAYAERIVQYMNKALKEAKVNTSWINPHEQYDKAVEAFIRKILTLNTPFLEDLRSFVAEISPAGLYNSLSQVLLKAFCPGIPDFYQGCELWNFSLVDPDNRKPIDFANMEKLLDEVEAESKDPLPFLERAANNFYDGKIKLYLTRQTLLFRRRHKELFLKGDYSPIEAAGEQDSHVIACSRSWNGRTLVAAAGRCLQKFCARDSDPLGRTTWGETYLCLPDGTYQDQLTKLDFKVAAGKAYLSDLFSHLPLALLEKQ